MSSGHFNIYNRRILQFVFIFTPDHNVISLRLYITWPFDQFAHISQLVFASSDTGYCLSALLLYTASHAMQELIFNVNGYFAKKLIFCINKPFFVRKKPSDN